MDRFDKVFCWTLTVPVVGASCYFFFTTTSMWESALVGALATVCVWHIWTDVYKKSRKFAAEQKLDAARRRFDLAAAAFMRALDEGVAGSPSRYTEQGRELLAAWNDYRGLLDGSAELIEPLRR